MQKVSQSKIDIVRCALIKEKCFKYQDSISSSDLAAGIFKDYIGDRDREVFAVIGLDTQNKPTFLNIVSIGQLGEARVNMRELFKPVILSNSASIIIGHNHPAGCMQPSNEDLVITGKINKVGNMLGIYLLDHIIVSCEEAISLRENHPELFS